MLNEVGEDGERTCTGDGGCGRGSGGVDREGEEGESVHKHPQATRVPSVVGEATIAPPPCHTQWEDVRIKLQQMDYMKETTPPTTTCQ